jgi:hypothetical protein
VLRVFKQLVLGVLLVEKGEPHDGEGSEGDVVQLVEPSLIERLASKA